jgi:SAM-dependent methyltransferase
MLQQAHHHDRSLSLVQGTAGQLPFAAEAFDWIYCVNAIHHFDQPDQFVSETYRSLRPGGWLAVIGSDPHEDRERWYGYQYFPRTYQTDLARFPGEQQLAHWFAKAGFLGFDRQVVERISKLQSGREVLSDPYLQKSSCSQLALLSETDYAVGLANVERAIEQAEQRGEEIAFRTEITIFMWCGQKI